MEDVLKIALGTFIGNGVIILLLLAQHEAEQRKKRAAAKEVVNDAKGFVDEMFAELKEEQHAREIAEAVAKDIIGKRKPKATDAAKIEKAFHENMEDHWAKVTFDKKTGKFDIIIQKAPFETTKPKRSRKPAAKAPVKKSANAVKPRKPATKKVGK